MAKGDPRHTDPREVLARVSMAALEEFLASEGIHQPVVTDAHGHIVAKGSLRAFIADGLHEQGLGEVPIATVLGVSQRTIGRDLMGRSQYRKTPQRQKTVSIDGKLQAGRKVPLVIPVSCVPIERREYNLIQAPFQKGSMRFAEPFCDAIITQTAASCGAGTPDGGGCPLTEPQFGVLAGMATVAVRQGAHTLMMVTDAELPSCLKAFSMHGIPYRSVLAFERPGARWSQGRVTLDWCPLLWFTRGAAERGPVWPLEGHGVADGARVDARLHWRDLIEGFTQPGDMILDPLLTHPEVLFAGIETGRRVTGVTESGEIRGIDALAQEVLLRQRVRVASDRFEEGFRFRGADRRRLLVTRRGSRTKPFDLEEKRDAVLVPFLRDEMGFDGDVVPGLVEPMLAELQRRAAERLEQS